MIAANGTKETAYTDQELRLRELALNAAYSRLELFRRLADPRRSVYDECGWPTDLSDPDINVYQRLYDRFSIAQRVVEVCETEEIIR